MSSRRGSPLYRDTGVVLRHYKLGEADRIVTMMTLGHGKVRAVAKGIRKTTSKFGARLEPASRVALQCYLGRELDVVTQVETLESNRALREEPGLQGKVVLSLTIAPDGNVTTLRIVSSELKTPELEAKLLARIRQFDFGAKDVEVMVVSWPVDFLPS